MPSVGPADGFERVQAQTFRIFFDYGNATIAGSAGQIVDAISDAFRRSGGRSIRIVGHTDGDEAREGKAALAQQRSAAIRAALVARGVAAGRITVVNGGVSRITGRPAREPQDRRADITINN